MRVGVVGRACALSHDGQTPTGKYKVPGPTLLRVVDLYVKEGRGGRALKSQIPCLSPLNMTPVRRVGKMGILRTVDVVVIRQLSK